MGIPDGPVRVLWAFLRVPWACRGLPGPSKAFQGRCQAKFQVPKNIDLGLNGVAMACHGPI